MSINHRKVCLLADTADPSLVHPSNWNDSLVMSGGSDGQLAQRDQADPDGWSWTSSLVLDSGPSGDNRFLKARLSDNGAVGDFNFWTGSVPNLNDPSRSDHVLEIGYNVSRAGGIAAREDLGEPSFGWVVEDYFNPSPGQNFLESYWEYMDASGTVLRPMQFTVDRTNVLNSTFLIRSNAFSFLAQNNVQYFKWQQQQMLALNGAVISGFTNNSQWLQQINVAGDHLVTLMYLDSSNRIVLGGNNATGLRAQGSVAPALSGTRYLVIDASGNITSSATPPSGT